MKTASKKITTLTETMTNNVEYVNDDDDHDSNDDGNENDDHRKDDDDDIDVDEIPLGLHADGDGHWKEIEE